MKYVLFVVVNAAAVAVAAWMFAGITVSGSGILHSPRADHWLTVAIVGVILGLLNKTLGALVKVLALPFVILTLGLGLLVINALMLLLASRIAQALNLTFHVHGFWTAVGGGLVISITCMVLEALLPDPKS
ncbi:MAG: phage holin family protein [Nocardioidaceae bacterium]|nr:phage holin family protein [Nocardioidaceae bacterium]MCL2612970.1 phage holin family protein [Nocardioidaceae bacterium]